MNNVENKEFVFQVSTWKKKDFSAAAENVFVAVTKIFATVDTTSVS